MKPFKCTNEWIIVNRIINDKKASLEIIEKFYFQTILLQIINYLEREREREWEREREREWVRERESVCVCVCVCVWTGFGIK